MKSFTDWATVPDEYRLSFVVGEIVRNDVYAENETKVLFNTLRTHGVPCEEEMPRDFGKVIPLVRAMLGLPQVPATFGKIATRVIELTSRAHAVRRDTVHDILIQIPYEPERIGSGLGTNSRSMSDLEKCADNLKEATWRLRAVWVIAPHWLGGPTDEWETAERLTSWTRVAMGHIADDPSEIRGTPGKTQIPLPESSVRGELGRIPKTH